MSYFGSKGGNGVWQRIVGSMPPHDVYIEPFLGSGQVMLRKPPAAVHVGIDIDADLVAAYDRASGEELIHGDAFLLLPDLVKKYLANDLCVLVYIDAPYHLETRTSDKRYKYDFEHGEHMRLLAMVTALPCDVILSHYPHPFYDKALADWRRWEFTAPTRGGPRREVLYMNYPAREPFAVDMVGADHDCRRRIKRKAARWARMLADMPPGERHAVFAACCLAMV